MEIRYRQPRETADLSARRGSDLREFVRLAVLAVVLCIGLVFAVGALVDVAVSRISVEQEDRLFAGLRNFGGFDEGSPRVAGIAPLFERLQKNSLVPALSYRLVVLEQRAPNAFALPGGTIGLTSGLLDAVDGELELAFVLAHEFGHFHNRDHLRNLGRAVGIGILFGLLLQQSDVVALTEIPALAMSSSYSRAAETRADEFALRLIYAEFGTIEGFDALFRSLQQRRSQPVWEEMFATHPEPDDRIRHLREYFERELRSVPAAEGSFGAR